MILRSSRGRRKRSQLWDLGSGSRVATVPPNSDPLSDLAFSSSGPRIVFRSKDGSLRLWDPIGEVEVATLEDFPGRDNEFTFSSDGSRLILISHEERTSKSETLDGDALASSPDAYGWRVLVSNPLVRLWDTTSGAQILMLEERRGWSETLTYSADSSRLAIAWHDKTVQLWETVSGTELTTLSGCTGRVRALAFSPDKSLLATVSENDELAKSLQSEQDDTALASDSVEEQQTPSTLKYSVQLWNAISGKEIVAVASRTGPVHNIKFSPDGLRLAWISGKTLRLWDTASGTEVAMLYSDAGEIARLEFSPDGLHLAFVALDSPWVVLCDPISGAEVAKLDCDDERLYYVGAIHFAFSRDGLRMVSSSDGKRLKLWDLVHKRAVAKLEGHSNQIGCFAFSPDGSRIASVSVMGTVRLWDVEATMGDDNTTKYHPVPTFSPDGSRLVSPLLDNTVRVWDPVSGAEFATLKGHSHTIGRLIFSPDGSRLVTIEGPTSQSSDDSEITGKNSARLWDPIRGVEVTVLRDAIGWVRDVKFSLEGSRLALLWSDETIQLHNSTTGEEVGRHEGGTWSINSLIFSPDGSRLAWILSPPYDHADHLEGELELRDTTSWMEVMKRVGRRRVSSLLKYSPDGLRLASPSIFDTVELLDGVSGAEVATLTGHNHAIGCLVFSPDASRLVSMECPPDEVRGGSTLPLGEFSARLWDSVQGLEIVTLRGDIDWSFPVEFLPDGSRFVSISAGGTMRLWDSITGTELATFESHSREVEQLTFSPDGSRLSFHWPSQVWDFPGKNTSPQNPRNEPSSSTSKGDIHSLFKGGWLYAFKDGGSVLRVCHLPTELAICAWDSWAPKGVVESRGIVVIPGRDGRLIVVDLQELFA